MAENEAIENKVILDNVIVREEKLIEILGQWADQIAK
jgi:hypothetical protein